MSKSITLFENLRAVPYAPFYLAIARGDWEREGLAVRVETSPAMSQTAEALIDGRTDVSWGGPMRVMLNHDKDPDCPLVCFGQVVARDPFILVGRKPNERFRFRDLSGLKVAIAEEAPTPWMTFQDALRRAGISPAKLNRTPGRPMSENVIAFESGQIDVIQVFEPYAEELVSRGTGHIWHRFAERGDIAYTSFYTTRAFTRRNRKTCQALVRGIAQAQKALYRQSATETANAIRPFFPDLSQGRLVRMIAGYRGSSLWAKTPALPPKSFVRLKAALLSGGLIRRVIPYENAIDESLSDTLLDDD